MSFKELFHFSEFLKSLIHAKCYTFYENSLKVWILVFQKLFNMLFQIIKRFNAHSTWLPRYAHKWTFSMRQKIFISTKQAPSLLVSHGVCLQHRLQIPQTSIKKIFNALSSSESSSKLLSQHTKLPSSNFETNFTPHAVLRNFFRCDITIEHVPRNEMKKNYRKMIGRNHLIKYVFRRAVFMIWWTRRSADIDSRC